MAISGGIDWTTAQNTLFDFVKHCTGLADDHIVWGHQQAPRPTQPGIIMHLNMMDDSIRPWVDTKTKTLIIPTITITSVDATANTFTKTAHGLLTGDGPVVLSSTGTLPGNVTEETNYWIIWVDANTFKLAATFQDAMNGVVLDLSDAGTGTITLDDLPLTVRAGEEITFLQRSYQRAILTLESYTETAVGANMASALLWRIQSKYLLPAAVEILEQGKIVINNINPVKVYGGTQSQYLFEPRAMMDIVITLVSEDSEDATIIETVEVSSEDPPMTFTIEVEDAEDGLAAPFSFPLSG